MGNGYFSNNRGNRTIASHCSPIFVERKPKKICQSSIHVRKIEFEEIYASNIIWIDQHENLMESHIVSYTYV